MSVITVQSLLSLNKSMPPFDKDYWDQNYSEPQTMDCIGNATDHVRYLKAFLQLEQIDVSSVLDLGFGYGYLFQKVLKSFLPYKACGIEPSRYAFEKARSRKLRPVESTKLSLLNESLYDWCQRKDSKRLSFDLGICTSVLQYVSEQELKETLPIISRRVKYLYLTVPTDKELDRQVRELAFDDTYALKRSKKFYRDNIGEHFTNISSKIWESKFYFNEETTLLTDLIYRS